MTHSVLTKKKTFNSHALPWEQGNWSRHAIKSSAESQWMFCFFTYIQVNFFQKVPFFLIMLSKNLIKNLHDITAVNFLVTGKSLSEALLFAEHGENMLCTKIVLNVRNNFCSPQVWAWKFHVLNFSFNEQSAVLLWVSWCKNKSFWQRFTCMYVHF